MVAVNRQWCIARRPEGRASVADFAWRETPVPGIAEGQALVRNLFLSLGVCRTWVVDSETVGERGQILTISTHISGIRQEKAARYGLFSHRCSRIIPSPTDS